MGRTALDRRSRTTLFRGAAARAATAPGGASTRATRAATDTSPRPAAARRPASRATARRDRPARPAPQRQGRQGRPEPISVSRLVWGGLALSVALFLGFAMIGAFGPLAFGALAGLWALGIAWIMIYGPPAVDRRTMWAGLRPAGTSLLATSRTMASRSARSAWSAWSAWRGVPAAAARARQLRERRPSTDAGTQATATGGHTTGGSTPDASPSPARRSPRRRTRPGSA